MFLVRLPCRHSSVGLVCIVLGVCAAPAAASIVVAGSHARGTVTLSQWRDVDTGEVFTTLPEGCEAEITIGTPMGARSVEGNASADWSPEPTIHTGGIFGTGGRGWGLTLAMTSGAQAQPAGRALAEGGLDGFLTVNNFGNRGHWEVTFDISWYWDSVSQGDDPLGLEGHSGPNVTINTSLLVEPYLLISEGESTAYPSGPFMLNDGGSQQYTLELLSLSGVGQQRAIDIHVGSQAAVGAVAVPPPGSLSLAVAGGAMVVPRRRRFTHWRASRQWHGDWDRVPLAACQPVRRPAA